MATRKTFRNFFAPALKEGEVLPIDPTNPLKNQIAAVDAHIARGLAAGLSVIEIIAQVVPSIQQEREAKAARIKEDNARKTAKRLARQAALDDPEKRERERVSFQKRMKEIARKKAARLERLEREAKKKAQALAENSTLAWRHPRRKGWLKPEDGTPSAQL